MQEPFKLEVFLKLKKFAEFQEKVRLGKILKKIEEEKTKIALLNESLSQMHEHQAANLDKGLESKVLRSYPRVTVGMEEEMKNYKKNLENLENDYVQVRKRLNVVLGEVEVLQKLESEHKENCKKKMNIKKDQEIEDIINMRRRE